jgi:hypothetical protein
MNNSIDTYKKSPSPKIFVCIEVENNRGTVLLLHPLSHWDKIAPDLKKHQGIINTVKTCDKLQSLMKTADYNSMA